MYFSQDEYKKIMWKFLNDHHGQIIKLKDENDRIFSYIIRCEANKKNKNVLLFTLSFDLFYANPRTKFRPNAKAFKYYAIKRTLEKWKNIKKDEYIKYTDSLTDEFYDKILSDVKLVRSMYNEFGFDSSFDEKNTTDYIFKVLKSIKNYYKNENMEDFSLILL